MTTTKSFRRARARLGALAVLERHDPKEITRPAREARWQKLLRDVDPQGELPLEERERRAQKRLEGQMQRLSMKAAAARSKRKATKASASSAA